MCFAEKQTGGCGYPTACQLHCKTCLANRRLGDNVVFVNSEVGVIHVCLGSSASCSCPRVVEEAYLRLLTKDLKFTQTYTEVLNIMLENRRGFPRGNRLFNSNMICRLDQTELVLNVSFLLSSYSLRNASVCLKEK